MITADNKWIALRFFFISIMDLLILFLLLKLQIWRYSQINKKGLHIHQLIADLYILNLQLWSYSSIFWCLVHRQIHSKFHKIFPPELPALSLYIHLHRQCIQVYNMSYLYSTISTYVLHQQDFNHQNLNLHTCLFSSPKGHLASSI